MALQLQRLLSTVALLEVYGRDFTPAPFGKVS
jgi:hypothetical protein